MNNALINKIESSILSLQEVLKELRMFNMANGKPVEWRNPADVNPKYLPEGHRFLTQSEFESNQKGYHRMFGHVFAMFKNNRGEWYVDKTENWSGDSVEFTYCTDLPLVGEVVQPKKILRKRKHVAVLQNPECVPYSKIPKGYRFMTKKEFDSHEFEGKCWMYERDFSKFFTDRQYMGNASDRSYIVKK